MSKIFLVQVALLVTAAMGLLRPTIYSDPPTVQTKSVAIHFFAVPEQGIPAGGKIFLSAPDTVQVYSGQDVRCEPVLPMLNDCQVTVSAQTFIVTTSVTLPADDQFQFKITKAIDNPISTAPTESWSILTSVGEGQDEGMSLTATAGVVNNFRLEPESDMVGASTNLVLKWSGAHKVPKGSFFEITFPKWNTEQKTLTLQKSYFQGSLSCQPITVLSASLTCTFQNDKLVIRDGASVDIGPNADIQVLITGFTNPIDTSVFTGFSVRSLVKEQNVFYPIDVGYGSLQITDYALISGAKLEVVDLGDPTAGMIQQSDEMKLSFILPVPLNQGCKVTVVLPSQYSVSTIKEIKTFLAFGASRAYTVTQGTLFIDSQENSFMIEPCDEYKDNNLEGMIRIKDLMQYKFEQPSGSLQIRIQTQHNDKIARVQSGVTFTPIKGVTEVAITATNSVIQSLTHLRITLTPQHKIWASDAPQVVITFPSQIKVTSCTVTETSTPSPKCDRSSQDQQTVVVKNFMANDYDPATRQPLTFTIGEVVNPDSTKPVDGLEILILAKGLYAIDEFSGYTPWLLTTGTLTDVNVNPGSDDANKAENTYMITFTPTHQIPINGYIVISIPNEIKVPDPSYSSSSCKAPQPQGFPIEKITCQFQELESDTGFYKLYILNAFRRSVGQANKAYTIELPGMQNPIKITTTPPFTIQTFTSDDYGIDSFTGSGVTMMNAAEIEEVRLVPSNFVNSKRVAYNFTIVPSVTLTQGMAILISFPEQIGVPEADSQISCASTQYPHLISGITCQRDRRPKAEPRTVQIDLQMKTGRIDALDRFAFKLEGLTNPPSTRTSDSIRVRIVDGQSFTSVNEKRHGVTVTTIEPYPIQRAEIRPGSYEPGVATTYIIDFYPEHSIGEKGGIIIVYPPQIAVMPNANIDVEASVTGLTLSTVLYANHEESARQIVIENLIQGVSLWVPTEGSLIQLKISGLKTPVTDKPTDSFEVSTFNVTKTEQFFIDTVKDNLFIKSKCSYPCNTCLDEDPSFCTSCFQTSNNDIGLPYLQKGTCVSECNFGRFFNSVTNQCDKCDHTCLSCEGQANFCTACGVDDYPFFHENKCLSKCHEGFLGSFSANQCQKCAPSCAACENTLSTCTKCHQDSALPFLYRESCRESCPPDVSVLDVKTQECVQCDPTCQTCAGSVTQCTSCDGFMKFDPVNQKCIAECQPETQIYNPAFERCDACNETCSKCQGDVNKCTECKPGYVLNKDFTCQATCRDELEEVKQTPINSICMDCEEPCYTCLSKTNHCTSCLRDPIKYLLHQEKDCVQYCPSKYNVTDDGLRCVYVGLECPELYVVDQSGNACVPVLFECAEGYELNEFRTACVPAPGSPIPFPFLIASIFVSFLVLGSYLKEKFFTKVYTCLISIIGSFEIVMYGQIVGFSAYAGEWIICAFGSVAFVALVTSNIVFTIYYQRDIYGKDQVLSKWLFFFPNTKKMIPIACCLINFKCSKILYSGFYGLESSMAQFGKPMEFYRVIRMVSYFSWIFCYGFLFIADILIIAKIRWGYQLLVLAYESAILAILVIVLTYFELRKNPNQLLSVGATQYTSIRPRSGRELKVKAGVEMDSDDYEEGIPEVDEMDLIRTRERFHQREINLRQAAFCSIVKRVRNNIRNGIDESACEPLMTKFDPEYTRHRRAYSMRAKTTADDSADEWLSEDAQSIVDIAEERRQYLRDRRYSWPLLLTAQEEIETEKFDNQIQGILNVDSEYLINNCGAEVKKVTVEQIKPAIKMVSRRTQTYLRELLELEGNHQNESDQSIIMDDDAEIDETYAKGLIGDVIANVSGNEAASDFDLKEDSLVKQPEPEFDLQEILGVFDVDDLGNFVIIRKAGSTQLIDKRGKRVNRRGYLIDSEGNVINQQGHMIFQAAELDEDDEIPAPFEQVKERLKSKFSIMNTQDPVTADLHKSLADLASSKQREFTREKNDEIVGDLIDGDQSEPPEELLAGDIDSQIADITKPKVPKKRTRMKDQRPSHLVLNNYPPRRLGHNASGNLYPMIEIENEEQRRLAAIANNIQGEAQRLAIDTGKIKVEFEMMSNEERFKAVKEQLYNDIMDSSRGLIQVQHNSRAHSAHNYDGKRKARPQTGHTSSHQQHISIQQRPSRQHPESTHNLNRVYNNIDQLVGLQSQQVNSLIQESQHVSRFGQRINTQKLQGIENIYMGKQNLSRQNSHFRSQNIAQPVRPLMGQFVDDPAGLIVDTGMDGTRFGATQSHDVSVVMAERVDRIQKNYIQQQFKNLPPLPIRRKPSEVELSEYRMPISPSFSKGSKSGGVLPPTGIIRQDNWLQ